MAKTLSMDKIFSELDKAENRNELNTAFLEIKDFVVKKLSAEKEDALSVVGEIDEVIKKINGN
jgi:hypothetical protein